MAMLPPRHLKMAPIVEAVLDIRVRPRSGFAIADLDKLGTVLGGEFRERKSVFQGNIEIDIGPQDPTTKIERQLSGFQFWSEDKLNVAMLKKDGFSMSRLRPYITWEQIFTKMKPLAQLYLELTRPDEIVRLAVRYLNKISFPPNTSSLTGYLTAPPVVPDGLPQLTSSFLNHLVILDQSKGISAAVTQASQPGATNELVVLLDIDAFKSGNFKVDDPKIWSIFEQLREFKNLIFFASITETTAKLFE